MADDVLSYAPSKCLLEAAHASMLYAPSSYPLVPPCTDVKFGKATALREQQGTTVSCRDAVTFYRATESFDMTSVAVMEVY